MDLVIIRALLISVSFEIEIEILRFSCHIVGEVENM